MRYILSFTIILLTCFCAQANDTYIVWKIGTDSVYNPVTNIIEDGNFRRSALKYIYPFGKSLEKLPDFPSAVYITPQALELFSKYANGSAFDNIYRISMKLTDSISPDELKILVDSTIKNLDQADIKPRSSYFNALLKKFREASISKNIRFSASDIRDFIVLSHLQFIDAAYVASKPALLELSEKGKNFTEQDKIYLLRLETIFTEWSLLIFKKLWDSRIIELVGPAAESMQYMKDISPQSKNIIHSSARLLRSNQEKLYREFFKQYPSTFLLEHLISSADLKNLTESLSANLFLLPATQSIPEYTCFNNGAVSVKTINIDSSRMIPYAESPAHFAELLCKTLQTVNKNNDNQHVVVMIDFSALCEKFGTYDCASVIDHTFRKEKITLKPLSALSASETLDFSLTADTAPENLVSGANSLAALTGFSPDTIQNAGIQLLNNTSSDTVLHFFEKTAASKPSVSVTQPPKLTTKPVSQPSGTLSPVTDGTFSPGEGWEKAGRIQLAAPLESVYYCYDNAYIYFMITSPDSIGSLVGKDYDFEFSFMPGKLKSASYKAVISFSESTSFLYFWNNEGWVMYRGLSDTVLNNVLELKIPISFLIQNPQKLGWKFSLYENKKELYATKNAFFDLSSLTEIAAAGPKINITAPHKSSTINDGIKIKVQYSSGAANTLINPHSLVIKLDGDIITPDETDSAGAYVQLKKQLSEGRHIVEASIMDNLGVSSNIARSDFFTDRTPPTLNPQIQNSVKYDSKMLFSAKVTDNVRISNAYLFMRPAGSSNAYDKFVMSPVLTGDYCASVPSSAVLPGEKYEYYFIASDGSNFVTAPVDFKTPYYVTFGKDTAAPSIRYTKYSVSGGYHNISFSLDEIAHISVELTDTKGDVIEKCFERDDAVGFITYAFEERYVPFLKNLSGNIRITATDRSGNTSSDLIQLTSAHLSSKTPLVFVVTLSQPYSILADLAADAAYNGLIVCMRSNPEIPFSIYASGSLIHAAQWFKSDYLKMIQEECIRGKWEMMGGPYTPCILPALDQENVSLQCEEGYKIMSGLTKRTESFFVPFSAYTATIIPEISQLGYNSLVLDDRMFSKRSLNGVYTLSYCGYDVKALEIDSALSREFMDAAVTGEHSDFIRLLAQTLEKEPSKALCIHIIGETLGLKQWQSGKDPVDVYKSLSALLEKMKAIQSIEFKTVSDCLSELPPAEEESEKLSYIPSYLSPDPALNWDDFFGFSTTLQRYKNIYEEIVKLRDEYTLRYPRLRDAINRNLVIHQYNFGLYDPDFAVEDYEKVKTCYTTIHAAQQLKKRDRTDSYEADVNNDDIDEVILSNSSSMAVFSKYGGRLIAWYDFRKKSLIAGNPYPVIVGEAFSDNKPAEPVRWKSERQKPLNGDETREYHVRPGMFNDNFTINGIPEYHIKSALYDTVIEGNTVTFSLKTAYGLFEKRFTLRDYIDVDYTFKNYSKNPLDIGIIIENELCPDADIAMNNPHLYLQYTDHGVKNTKTHSEISFKIYSKPEKILKTNSFGGLEYNLKYFFSPVKANGQLKILFSVKK